MRMCTWKPDVDFQVFSHLSVLSGASHLTDEFQGPVCLSLSPNPELGLQDAGTPECYTKPLVLKYEDSEP